MATKRRGPDESKTVHTRHSGVVGDDFEDTESPGEILSLDQHVVCTRERDGCEWRGTVGELGTIKQHLRTCLYEPVTCVCEERVQRRQLEDHQTQDCPLRRHTCILCEETGTYAFVMGEHLIACPEVVVHCTNDECSVTFKRQERDKHQRECPYRMVQCTNKCRKEVKCVALVHHLEHECLKRTTTCSYCKEEGMCVFITGDHLCDCPALPLPCVNEGCDEKIKRRDMLDHCYRHCLHQIIGCGNGCGHEMKRGELTEHETTRCLKRVVSCAHCGKRGTSELILGDHKDSCMEVCLPCHNEGCLETIRRRSLKEHHDDCPHGLVSCPYSSVGCYAAIKHRDLATHKIENTDRHLSLAMEYIVQKEQHLTSRINQCEKQLLDGQGVWEMEKLNLTHKLNHITIRLDQYERQAMLENEKLMQKIDHMETKNILDLMDLQLGSRKRRASTRDPPSSIRSTWKWTVALCVCFVLLCGLAVARETTINVIIAVLCATLMLACFITTPQNYNENEA